MTREDLLTKRDQLRAELDAPVNAEKEKRAALAKLETEIAAAEAEAERQAAISRLQGCQGKAAAADDMLATALKNREKHLRMLEADDAAINTAAANKADATNDARNICADYGLEMPALGPCVVPSRLMLRQSNVAHLARLPQREPNRREREEAERRAQAEEEARQRQNAAFGESLRRSGIGTQAAQMRDLARRGVPVSSQ
jgi:hypothetical protein